MLISALLFWPTISPWLSPNSHTQDINPLALSGRISSIFPPAIHLSCSELVLIPTISPPLFSKDGFLLVEMVETSSALTYFWEGIKVTPPGPQAHSSGGTPPWALCSLLHAPQISYAWNFGLQILAFKSNIFIFAKCKESSSNMLRLTLLNAYYNPLIPLHNGKT